MALFPDCELKVLLRGGAVAGSRVEGTVVLDAPEDIPRAERVQIALHSKVVAGYGSGKSRSVKRATLLHLPLEVALPGSIAAGAHRYSFVLDLPPWLPLAYVGNDCSIENTIEARVDVDWAIDPKLIVSPEVSLPPVDAPSAPLVTRSYTGFHEEVVLEVNLASTTTALGGVVEGSVALRSGHQARFDALVLTLAGFATISFGRGDKRPDLTAIIRLPRERVTSGAAIPFRFTLAEPLLPTFENGFIDHGCELVVSLEVPWAFDPTFAIPLVVLPRGSHIHGAPSPIALGNARLRLTAEAMARASGLSVGREPVMVGGTVGPVTLRIVDAPKGTHLGVDVELSFPDVELGLELRPERLLDFGSSSLLPPAFASGYALRLRPDQGRPEAPESAVARFLEMVLGDVARATEVRVGDQHVRIHIDTPDDSGEPMSALAKAAVASARTLAAAIDELPFPSPVAPAEEAWRKASRELEAFLVPSGPALHGVELRARVVGGDERVLRAVLSTRWEEATRPLARVDIDLSAMPLPPRAADALRSEAAPDGPAATLERFPTVVVAEPTSVTLEATGWEDDPRAWVPALDAFFAWALETRGEKRAGSAYR